ncbi:MAG: acid phosphatase [Acidobacteriota bacterium]|nr:acid phosphatase [Acidobacteriota bacterium]
MSIRWRTWARKDRVSLVAAFAALLALLSPLASSGATGATLPTTVRPCATTTSAHYTHVVWILLENEGYGVIGSSSAPYLNSLSDHCGLATNDFATNHPSLPNYIALTSGSAQGIVDDNEPSSHPLRVPSIFSQLKANWRTYAESMPTACDRVTSGTYAARHNPAVYYTNLANCAGRDVALRSPLDLSAAFTMIVPNVCNDMHSCPVATGDAWLKKYVTQILSSPQYHSRSLALFITFDESTQSSSNQIPTVVVAPSVPAGIRVATHFTHYSLLRTTETLLHLPLLGAARTATSMLGAFHL